MNVLVVDDETGICELLKRWLSARGYDVLEAHDAETALAMLAAQPVAVALCDRSMPGKDGVWLIEQIRAHHTHVAIILATADDALPTRISLQRGVLGYLVKPFKEDLVLSAVADAIAWHRAAANATSREATSDTAIEAWLRGRAGRPEPKREP